MRKKVLTFYGTSTRPSVALVFRFCKRSLLLFLMALLFFTFDSNAQVKIGDELEKINEGAILQLESKDKAFVPPRMDTEQRDAIRSPLKGAMIFNIDLECMQVNLGDTEVPSWECMNGELPTDEVIDAQSQSRGGCLVTIWFKNTGCQKTDVFFNDNGRHLKYYTTISVGGRWGVRTYKGHNWVFKTNGSIVQTYTVETCNDATKSINSGGCSNDGGGDSVSDEEGPKGPRIREI